MVATPATTRPAAPTGAAVATRAAVPSRLAIRTRPGEVFLLWCALTGYHAADFDDLELEAFLSRPELPALAATPGAVLRDAGEAVRRPRSLPLERWLAAVRVVRPDR